MATKFSDTDKMKAVRLMLQGDTTQKQIAEKFGCSVPALQLWRKEFQEQVQNEEEEECEEEIEAEEEAPYIYRKPQPSVSTSSTYKTLLELKKKFWEQNSKTAAILLEPTADNKEFFNSVNEILEFAHNYLTK